MNTTITIRLDKDLDLDLTKLAKRTGRSKSDLAREALRKQFAIQRFRKLRRRAMPYAEAAGYLTDEDVYRDIKTPTTYRFLPALSRPIPTHSLLVTRNYSRSTRWVICRLSTPADFGGCSKAVSMSNGIALKAYPAAKFATGFG